MNDLDQEMNVKTEKAMRSFRDSLVGLDKRHVVPGEEMARPQKPDEFVAAAYLRVADAQIPRLFRGGFADWKEYAPEHTTVAATARKWVEGYKRYATRGLVLYGAVGCGKTHLACAILKALIERGVTKCLYCNVLELFLRIRSTWAGRKHDETTMDIVRHLLAQDVLLLDDFGSQRQEDLEGEIFYTLFDTIARNQKPTLLISTNFKTAKQHADHFNSDNGRRILSRLRAMCAPLGPFPEMDVRIEIKKGENQ